MPPSAIPSSLAVSQRNAACREPVTAQINSGSASNGGMSAAAWKARRKLVEAVCAACRSSFMAVASEIKRGRGRVCSLGCAAALAAIGRDQAGPANNNWRGGGDNTGRKRRYRESNPEKHAAHIAMRNAIRRGELSRGPCEVCGCLKRVEGHHDDYSRPLNVRWLCKRHHIAAHNGRFGIKPGPHFNSSSASTLAEEAGRPHDGRVPSRLNTFLQRVFLRCGARAGDASPTLPGLLFLTAPATGEDRCVPVLALFPGLA